MVRVIKEREFINMNSNNTTPFVPPFECLRHFDSKYPVVEIEYSGSDLSAFILYL